MLRKTESEKVREREGGRESGRSLTNERSDQEEGLQFVVLEGPFGVQRQRKEVSSAVEAAPPARRAEHNLTPFLGERSLTKPMPC